MDCRAAIVIVCVGALGALDGAAAAHAQIVRVQPGLIERVMPDFSLPGLDGRVLALSQLKARAVVVVFPRGKVAEADGSDPHWCQLCQYQYAELAELEKTTSFRAALNVEVLFVLPYGGHEVAEWASIIPKDRGDPFQVHEPEHVRPSERELPRSGHPATGRLSRHSAPSCRFSSGRVVTVPSVGLPGLTAGRIAGCR